MVLMVMLQSYALSTSEQPLTCQRYVLQPQTAWSLRSSSEHGYRCTSHAEDLARVHHDVSLFRSCETLAMNVDMDKLCFQASHSWFKAEHQHQLANSEGVSFEVDMDLEI